MPPHKSEDYKITAVQYYLSKNNNQVKTCKIFKLTHFFNNFFSHFIC